MAGYDEARIARLLAELRPAPEDWVHDAESVPASHGTLAQVLAHARADRAFRAALERDVESALQDGGYGRDPDVVRTLRHRLKEQPEW